MLPQIRCYTDWDASHTCKPLSRVVEAVELQTTPVHEVEEEAAHAAVGFVEVVEHATTVKIAACAAEQDHWQLLGLMVAVQHAGAVHDSGVVEQGAVAFLDLGHPLAEVGELRHEELVERDQLVRLRVGDVMMVIADAEVRVHDGGGVVAVFHGRDPGGVRAEGKNEDVIHELPILRKVRRDAVGRPRTIGAGEGRLPFTGLAFLAGPLDAALDLVDGAEILLKALTVRAGEFPLQGLGVLEDGIDDAAVIAVALGAEELVKGERGPRFGPGGRHGRTPRNVRAVEQRMTVLKAGHRLLAAEHQRRQPGAVADLPRHHLVEADARVDLVLRHGRAAEHVARLHAVDDPVVRLLVPQTAQEDHALLPGLQRLQARAEFHRRTVSLGPPVLRVEPHAGEGDQRTRRRQTCGARGGSPGRFHAIEQRQGECRSDSAKRMAAADEPVVALDVHGWLLVLGYWLLVPCSWFLVLGSLFLAEWFRGCGPDAAEWIAADDHEQGV